MLKRLARKGFATFCGLAVAAGAGSSALAHAHASSPYVTLEQLNAIANQDYRVDRGDQINIVFRNSPELNDVVLVRPDGQISLAYINDLPAAGLTMPELRRNIIQSYAGILREPTLDLSVKSIANNQVFVGGEVGSPGMYPLTGHASLSQYLLLAGNTKATAARSRIMIIRRDEHFHPVYAVVDATRVYKGDAASDIALRPYDIIYVRKSLGGRLDSFAEVYIRNLIPMNFAISYLP